MACRGLPALPFVISRFRIAAVQTRRRVIATDECKCCGSKFGFEEDRFDTSRAGRDFCPVADRGRGDKFDLVSREDSPGRGDGYILGTLSGGGIFCALLRYRLRAVAASARAAERNVGAKARSLSAVIAPSAEKQFAESAHDN